MRTPVPVRKKHKPDWLTDDYCRILKMAQTYEVVISQYLHKPFFRAFKNTLYKGQLNKSYQTTLLRACSIAEEHNVDYTIYIESQLYWFDKWFRRHPKVFEISTYKGGRDSIWRLRQYLSLRKVNHITQSTYSIKVPQEKLSSKILDKQNQKVFDQLKQAWQCSDEKIMMMFAKSGMFSKSWIQSQPVYQRLRKERRI